MSFFAAPLCCRCRCRPCFVRSANGGFSNVCAICFDAINRQSSSPSSPSTPHLNVTITLRGYPPGFQPSIFPQVPVSAILNGIRTCMCGSSYPENLCPCGARSGFG